MTITYRVRSGVLAAAILVTLGACADDPVRPVAPSTQTNTGGAAMPQGDVGRTSELPSLRRVGITLNAVGSFRPGAPVVVTANGRANRPATNVEFDLLLLDGESGYEGPPGQVHRARPLAERQGALAALEQQALSATVTFSRPGYYRVLARAKSERVPGEFAEAAGDTAVLDLSSELLWILIDEKGGRLTQGFDSTAARSPTRVPLYGSYGPFIPRSSRQSGTSSLSAVALNSNTASGYVRYHDYDINGTRPIAGAPISIGCFNLDDGSYTTVSDASVAPTGSDGYFSFEVSCPLTEPGWVFNDARVQLVTPQTAVWGKDRNEASVSVYGPGVYNDLRVANDYAAHVYATLKVRVPMAVQRFGRSMSQTAVYVADADPNYGIYYCHVWATGCPRADVILQNYTRVFSEDGYFVSVHEFGHAYHYKAIEPWGSYSCTGNQHFWEETENLSCAFVEGFADFFAMWLSGDRLVTQPYGGDYGLENNVNSAGAPTNPPLGGDGVRVEAAVAAFLYDLADDGSELDGPTNGIGPPESFDNLTVPASWIADVIAYCRPGGTITRLNGADQLVYCFEKSTSAYTTSLAYSNAWRNYGSVSYDTPIATYDATAIRQLWKYNFYGVSP